METVEISETEFTEYDFIIIGGGISGSLMGISLMDNIPGIKVAIIEKSPIFTRKVGESTSDVAMLCLKSLGIDPLLQQHEKKAGLRYFFNEHDGDDSLVISELSSPALKGLNNGFHFDRKELDEDLLIKLQEKGADIFRPSTIVSTNFKPFSYYFAIKHEEKIRNLHATRVIDATGRSRYLSKSMEWKDLDVKLDTGAIMAYIKGIDFEALDFLKNKYWENHAINNSTFSTMHFMRPYSWWWLIRLDQDTTSIGFVFDKNMVTFSDPESFFRNQFETDPVLSKFISNSQVTNVRHIESLAYCSSKLYENGVTILGESGAFTDPMISPGIELTVQQIIWLTKLYKNDLSSDGFDQKAWSLYEKTFINSFLSRIEIYKQGYKIMEYYDLMSSWLKLGHFVYFSFYVIPAALFKHRLKKPVQIRGLGRLAFNYMKWRMNKITSKRKKLKKPVIVQSASTTYSGIRVPSGLSILFMPVKLFWIWFWSYITIEVKHLFKER